MAKNNLLLNLLKGALKKVGESQLEETFQYFHDEDLEGYEKAIMCFNEGVKLVTPHVLRSKSKIDDAILHAIDKAVKGSSAKNGVILE